MKPAGRITIGGGTPDVTVLFQVCHELLGGIDLDRPPYSFPCAARKNSPCSSVMIETTILAQDICTNSPVLTAAIRSRLTIHIFYGTHALPISICVPVIRSNSRLYLVIRFSSNTFSSIPTLSGL